jgi:hypothetical protein
MRGPRCLLVLAVLFTAAPTVLAQGFGAGFNRAGMTRATMSVSPLLNVYNGQTSLLQFQDFGYYQANLQVLQAGGQIAFVPQFQPVPVGVNYPAQAAVIGNGPYARLNLAPTFQTQSLGPPFPNTRFITPVFAGGASGSPVPFTNILYQPTFRQVSIQTSVSAPAGGGVFVGGFGFGGAGRFEFGPPLLGGMPFFGAGFLGD